MLGCPGCPAPQISEEEERAKAEYKEEKEVAKRKAKHDKAWEKTRDERVGTWRDFMQKSSKKAKTGGLGVCRGCAIAFSVLLWSVEGHHVRGVLGS